MKRLKIGVLRETKIPPDRRVPLTPVQCRELMERYPGLEIRVQASDYRCFSNEEFEKEGVPLVEDLGDCEILLGVKEVKIESLLEEKTYLFFSHTAKKQPYNRGLLKSVIAKRIRLIDYEYLTDVRQVRVVAFGRWAGVVGAYNGLLANGLRYGTYQLKAASLCRDLEEIKAELTKVHLGNYRIAVTGGGRVAAGATEILDAAGLLPVKPESYLTDTFIGPVYTRLDPWHYTRHKKGLDFNFDHFVAHPDQYENSFLPYAGKSDMFIACHFWDPRSPILLSNEDLLKQDNPLKVIADISCDINGPIPSTLRASTIAEPFYGYDPATGRETSPFKTEAISVMAVDNLPGELPRDASADFGSALMEHVLPELLGLEDTGMLDRASIADGGSLTELYYYLRDYIS